MVLTRDVDDAVDVLERGGHARLAVRLEHRAVDGDVSLLGQDAREERRRALEGTKEFRGVARAVEILG